MTITQIEALIGKKDAYGLDVARAVTRECNIGQYLPLFQLEILQNSIANLVLLLMEKKIAGGPAPPPGGSE
jgi:hypothetical protein